MRNWRLYILFRGLVLEGNLTSNTAWKSGYILQILLLWKLSETNKQTNKYRGTFLIPLLRAKPVRPVSHLDRKSSSQDFINCTKTAYAIDQALFTLTSHEDMAPFWSFWPLSSLSSRECAVLYSATMCLMTYQYLCLVRYLWIGAQNYTRINKC